MDSGDGSSDESTGDVYETVVVGNRLPEDPFLSRRAITVIDNAALSEKSPRTTPEALEHSPGVYVQKTNHGGGSPILRGMIGPQNLILVDGVRLNNSVYRTGPMQYLNLVDPHSLHRIEILRGPGSVLYGSDAMGGVIQLFPLEPRTHHEKTLAGGGALLGRYGSADQGGTAHGHFDAVYSGAGVLGGVTYKQFHDLSGGGDVGVQPYSGYDDLSLIGGATYRVRSGLLEGWSFKTVYLMSQIGDAGRTDKLYDKNSLQFYDNDDHLVYSRIHMELDPLHTSANLTGSYQAFFERKDNHRVDDDFQTRLNTTRDETTVGTLGLDLDLETALLNDRLRFSYGGMWYRDSVDAERMTRSFGPRYEWRPSSEANYPGGSTYQNYGGFLLIDGDPISMKTGHVLRIGGGYRLHGMSGDAPARDDLPAVSIDDLGHVFLGSLQYIFSDRATVAFTFSQGFRAPNLNEAVMLGDTGKYFHVPNGALQPERSDTFELLARGRFRGLTVGASTYLTGLTDLIKREETTWQGEEEVSDKPVAWNVNGDEGLLVGVEGEAALELDYGLSVLGHVTFTWGEEKNNDSADVPLTRIPPLFGQLTFRYDTQQTKEWRGYIETYMRAAAPQNRLSEEDENDARIPEDGTPGWWTWNVALGINVREHLRAGLDVQNLLNKKYKYHGSGVWAPGTNAVLTVSLFY